MQDINSSRVFTKSQDTVDKAIKKRFFCVPFYCIGKFLLFLNVFLDELFYFFNSIRRTCYFGNFSHIFDHLSSVRFLVQHCKHGFHQSNWILNFLRNKYKIDEIVGFAIWKLILTNLLKDIDVLINKSDTMKMIRERLPNADDTSNFLRFYFFLEFKNIFF